MTSRWRLLDRFTLILLAWVAALGTAAAALAWTTTQPHLGAACIVAALAVAGMLAGLVAHVRRTNLAVARFVEALRHRDFATGWDARGGAGFDALGRALTDTMRELRAERGRQADETRFLEALLDDTPVALLVADPLGGVRAANKAARSLFDRHQGTRPTDWTVYGDDLAARLSGEAEGARAIIPLTLDGAAQRAIVRGGTLERLGTPVRVVTVEPIQATLDAVEVGTQSDLVRVLTHEILNSLTPVTSLAGTAAVLLGEEEPDIEEARLAVMTLARRSEGLRRFIESYRAVARPPEPRRRRFEAATFAAEIRRLVEVDWIELRLTVAVEPGLVLDADPDLLAQALINLVRNAAQACLPAGGGRVRLSFATGSIAVEDDGPGVPEALHGDVFLPFFTTRAEGTGVGLNLVRQIVVAHGWRIAIENARPHGAVFTIHC